jgi:hypothetical protein
VKRYAFPLVALFALGAIAAPGGSARAHARSTVPTQVFILAGQSNMLGRGKPLSLASPTDPRLELWSSHTWQTAADPLGGDGAGIGPGMTFGLTLLQLEPDETVGLVMCAKGATSISDWQPGLQLYRNCVSQARAAGGHVAGVLFLQGESDAQSGDAAHKWKTRFQPVLDAFERDFGGNVPFVLGQIGKLDSSTFDYQSVVRTQQVDAANANPGVPLVTTLDLKVSGDGVHFTVPSYQTIGVRFATSWWSSAGNAGPGGSPPPLQPTQLFVLAGGSNMLGRGKLSSAQPSNQRVLVWRDGGWQIAADPLAPKGGVGPGLNFGATLLQYERSEAIGLVLCGKSSATMADWQPDRSLYRDCITSVRAAGVPVKGIVFLEGENDATSEAAASSWGAGFQPMLGAFRSDLGADIPFVLGQIGKLNKDDFQYQRRVRDQQAAAASTTPGVTLVTTSDLDVAGDGVTFTGDSYRTVGARFATAWWQVAGSG